MSQQDDPAIAAADAFYIADRAFDAALHSDRPWAGELALADLLAADTLFQEAVPSSSLGATLKLAHATGQLLKVLRDFDAGGTVNARIALRHICEAMARLSRSKADALPLLRLAHELLFFCPAEQELNDARRHVRTVIEAWRGHAW